MFSGRSSSIECRTRTSRPPTASGSHPARSPTARKVPSSTTIDPMETTTQADQITALRVALGAGPHADAPSPNVLEPYGPDDQLPEGAARALEARAPELAERARRLGLI